MTCALLVCIVAQNPHWRKSTLHIIIGVVKSSIMRFLHGYNYDAVIMISKVALIRKSQGVTRAQAGILIMHCYNVIIRAMHCIIAIGVYSTYH